MIIQYMENEPREFCASSEEVSEIKVKQYMLREKCDAKHLFKIIINHVDKYYFENGEPPTYLILGVVAYESLSATNFKMLNMYLSDKCMDLDIILDYRDELNVEVRGRASKDFINYIKNKYKD